MNRRGIKLATLAAMLAVAAPQVAPACSPGPGGFQRGIKPPALSRILSRHPLVFVGTVTQLQDRPPAGPDGKRPPRYATFQVEVAIKGVEGKSAIRIPSRGGGDCRHSFRVGERWFIAGDSGGASLFSGSTILAAPDASDGGRPDAHHQALLKAFPQIRTLPALETIKVTPAK